VTDAHHLLPRVVEGPISAERANAARVLEAEREAHANGEQVEARWARDPVDAVRLRGIPAVGPGMAGGAIRGTRPDMAVLRLDRV
jgi:hypothetical protein